MRKEILTAAILLLFANGLNAYVWERTNEDLTAHDRFQKIPPAQETADKLMRFFLGIPPEIIRELSEERRQRRSVPDVPDDLYQQYDAVFLIDGSNSITPDDFERMLNALQHLTAKAERGRRYAAITFSNKATLRFGYTERKHAAKKLGEIPFEAGKTNTQEALKMCREKLILNETSEARSGLKKRVLIITDGQSNINKTATLYEAFLLKKTGTPIFVIAIGDYLEGINEIVGLASSTDAHVYRVRDTQGLMEVVRLIPPWHIVKHYIKRAWLRGMLRGDD